MGMLKQLNLIFAKIVLSKKIRNRANRDFDRTLREFRKKKRRKPNRDEIFLLVVKASHRTLGVKRAIGEQGHMKRQWIRKYLLLRNNVRSNYKIQKSKRK